MKASSNTRSTATVTLCVRATNQAILRLFELFLRAAELAFEFAVEVAAAQCVSNSGIARSCYFRENHTKYKNCVP